MGALTGLANTTLGELAKVNRIERVLIRYYPVIPNGIESVLIGITQFIPDGISVFSLGLPWQNLILVVEILIY